MRFKTVRDLFDESLYAGAVELIQGSIQERVRRLEGLYDRVKNSHHINQLGLDDVELQYQQMFIQQWKRLCERLVEPCLDAPSCLTNAFSMSENYIETIQTLTDEIRAAGTLWLSTIVSEIEDKLDFSHE